MRSSKQRYETYLWPQRATNTSKSVGGGGRETRSNSTHEDRVVLGNMLATSPGPGCIERLMGC